MPKPQKFHDVQQQVSFWLHAVMLAKHMMKEEARSDLHKPVRQRLPLMRSEKRAKNLLSLLSGKVRALIEQKSDSCKLLYFYLKFAKVKSFPKSRVFDCCDSLPGRGSSMFKKRKKREGGARDTCSDLERLLKIVLTIYRLMV